MMRLTILFQGEEIMKFLSFPLVNLALLSFVHTDKEKGLGSIYSDSPNKSMQPTRVARR